MTIKKNFSLDVQLTLPHADNKINYCNNLPEFGCISLASSTTSSAETNEKIYNTISKSTFHKF